MYFCSSWHFKQQTPDLWHSDQVRRGIPFGRAEEILPPHTVKALPGLPFTDLAAYPGLCIRLPQSMGIMTESQLLQFPGLSQTMQTLAHLSESREKPCAKYSTCIQYVASSVPAAQPSSELLIKLPLQLENRDVEFAATCLFVFPLLSSPAIIHCSLVLK